MYYGFKSFFGAINILATREVSNVSGLRKSTLAQSRTVLLFRGIQLADEVLHALGSHLGAHVAVKRRRAATCKIRSDFTAVKWIVSSDNHLTRTDSTRNDLEMLHVPQHLDP